MNTNKGVKFRFVPSSYNLQDYFYRFKTAFYPSNGRISPLNEEYCDAGNFSSPDTQKLPPFNNKHFTSGLVGIYIYLIIST